MGSNDHYPEEAPGAPGRGRRVLDRPHPVTNARVRRRSSRRPATSTVAERPLDPADFPARRPRTWCPGSLVFPGRPGPSTCATSATGGRDARARTGGSPTGPGSTITAATTIRWSTSPTRMPRPTPRGPARSCRRRPSGSSPPAAASTARRTPGATSPSRRRRGWRTLAGRVPVARRADGYEGPRRWARSRRTATASTTWPATSGSGRPTGTPTATPRRRKPCCAPRNPRGGDAEEQLRPARSRRSAIPRKVIKGGSHLCADELLPALPAGGPAAADDRHRHEPHRLPLHSAHRRRRELRPARCLPPCRSG